MGNTKIDWCDKVWNPVTGCTKVGEGCRNCYAEKYAKRFWGDREFSEILYHPDRIFDPLKWRKPSFIFVVSMGDPFHEEVSYKQLDLIMEAILLSNPKHKYLFLTKRPRRMGGYFDQLDPWMKKSLQEIVWLGVSVENQEAARARIPILLEIPAAIHFVSVEPMLEEVALCRWIDRLDWVICGEETGPGKRHFEKWWAQNIMTDCAAWNVPFWWKNHPEYKQERPE